MKLAHIVATSQNNVIGVNGSLPWHLPQDLKRFKDITTGHKIVMGRITYESIGKTLPNRENIVISRNQDFFKKTSPAVADDSNLKIFSSLDDALLYCKNTSDQNEEVFIIGGGQLYSQSIDMIDKLYLTVLHQEVQGNTFYPKLDLTQFKKLEELSFTSPVPHSFYTYERI